MLVNIIGCILCNWFNYLTLLFEPARGGANAPGLLFNQIIIDDYT
jgi:hypothetical protein